MKDKLFPLNYIFGSLLQIRVASRTEIFTNISAH